MQDFRLLNNINSPEDVKAIPEKDIPELSSEIRQIIIETAAKNGGHLASNLGMVEATLAMHRVFSCPKDAFVFDVGHQCYTHKLLTGRYDRFSTLRQAGGISGFTNREESEYDAVTAGHSGTSISAAVGLAEANRIAGRDSWVVAVVGDGSFTNGMNFEALNHLADRDLRLIIILNDNEMSISKNIGGLSNYLSVIRTSEGYFNFKFNLKKFFSKIPLVGKALVRFARSVRDFAKRITNSETFFENLGLEYIGSVNGNDYKKLVSVLEEAKRCCRPVIVHIKTKKGLGYPPAEECPDKFHSTGGFSLDGDKSPKEAAKPTFAGEVSKLMLEKGEADKGFCALTAAMTEGCGLGEFAARFPERFFDVGIAEEHLITMAGGLSIGGMTPAAVLYSTFSQRVFDQLWHDVSLQRAHVILLLSHCGIVPGDGVTHQGIYDVSLMAEIPGCEIHSPDTFSGLRTSFEDAVAGDGLSVVRYPKGGEASYGELKFIDHGDWKDTVFGENYAEEILILTYGRVSENAAKAARAMSEKASVKVRLVVIRKIWPVPADIEFRDMISSAEKIFFVEEAYREGGICSRYSMELGKVICGISIDEPFVPHGDAKHLFALTGLDSESIAKRIIERL